MRSIHIEFNFGDKQIHAVDQLHTVLTVLNFEEQDETNVLTVFLHPILYAPALLDYKPLLSYRLLSAMRQEWMVQTHSTELTVLSTG